MNRRRRAHGALLVGLALVLVGGCGVPGDGTARGISEEDVPEGLRSVDEVAPRLPSDRTSIEVWLVHDGKLASTRHLVATDAGATGALEELLAGVSEAEQGRGLRSAIPDAAAIVGVTTARGTATVSLAPSFAEIPANDQLLAVSQIVMTLTGLAGIGRVQFVVDDVVVAVPLPSGASAEASVSRDDYIALTGA